MDRTPFQNGLMMVACSGACGGGIIAFEKFVESRFFVDLVFRLGIERFHVFQFVRSQLGKMANEMDQLPAVDVEVRLTLTPGRHRRKADAVVDDPEQFSIRHILTGRLSQIRSLGIDIFADRGLPAAVVRMAGRAMVCEMGESFLKDLRCGRYWVGFVAMF